jgi:hypothetical protein
MPTIKENTIVKWRDNFDGSMLDRIGYGLEEALENNQNEIDESTYHAGSFVTF